VKNTNIFLFVSLTHNNKNLTELEEMGVDFILVANHLSSFSNEYRIKLVFLVDNREKMEHSEKKEKMFHIFFHSI